MLIIYFIVIQCKIKHCLIIKQAIVLNMSNGRCGRERSFPDDSEEIKKNVKRKNNCG